VLVPYFAVLDRFLAEALLGQVLPERLLVAGDLLKDQIAARDVDDALVEVVEEITVVSEGLAPDYIGQLEADLGTAADVQHRLLQFLTKRQDRFEDV